MKDGDKLVRQWNLRKLQEEHIKYYTIPYRPDWTAMIVWWGWRN